MSNWEKLKKELALSTTNIVDSTSKNERRSDRGISLQAIRKRKRSCEQLSEGSNTHKLSLSKSPKHELWFDVSTDSVRHSRTGGRRGSGCGSLIPSLEQDRKALVTGTNTGITKCIAIDCEMVGGGARKKDQYDMLARCSIVNSNGQTVYNKYVAPMDNVADYRTTVSGVTPKDLKEGSVEFSKVQKEVSEMLNGRILIGHALHHDLKALYLSHPSKDIRDTSKYKPFREFSKGKSPSLKLLAESILGITIQNGAHDSVEDARVAMKLYQIHKRNWESSLKQKHRRKKK